MIEVLRGPLGVTPLPVLLGRYHQERLSGAIQISRELPESGPVSAMALLGQIFLRNGYPVEALLPGGADPLGTVLYETGALDRERYNRAQALQPDGSLRIGDLLLRGRLLDRPALAEGLRAQTRRRIHPLFFLQEASFQVFNGRHERGLLGTEPLFCESARIIYFGVRRAWSELQLRKAVHPLAGHELRLPGPLAAQVARGLPPVEARVCEMLGRGAWTLEELNAASGMPDRMLHALLFALLLGSGLELRPPMPGRFQRAARQVPKGAAIPYQPADEPLPPEQSSLPERGRPIQLQAGAGQAPPAARGAPRARTTTLVPIGAPDAERTPAEDPAPSALPPSAPSALAKEPVGKGNRIVPPPLRTGLPTARLRSRK